MLRELTISTAAKICVAGFNFVKVSNVRGSAIAAVSARFKKLIGSSSGELIPAGALNGKISPEIEVQNMIV